MGEKWGKLGLLASDRTHPPSIVHFHLVIDIESVDSGFDFQKDRFYQEPDKIFQQIQYSLEDVDGDEKGSIDDS